MQCFLDERHYEVSAQRVGMIIQGEHVVLFSASVLHTQVDCQKRCHRPSIYDILLIILT